MILDTFILICCALGAAASGVVSWAVSLADRAKRAEARAKDLELELKQTKAEASGLRGVLENFRRESRTHANAANIWRRNAEDADRKFYELVDMLTSRGVEDVEDASQLLPSLQKGVGRGKSN